MINRKHDKRRTRKGVRLFLFAGTTISSPKPMHLSCGRTMRVPTKILGNTAQSLQAGFVRCCLYIPVIPERAIPSVKCFCKKRYITRSGLIESRHPASFHTICSRGGISAVGELNILVFNIESRLFSISETVFESSRKVELT